MIEDHPGSRPVLRRIPRYSGSKWALVTDQVELSAATVVERDVVVHPGAVGIVALDEQDQIVMIRQYRHPVAAELWEIPAGLLDEETEEPWQTAERELIEEVGLRANTWHTLLDLYSSPGMSSEVVRVFLARGLSEVPSEERPPLVDEELDFVVRREPLQRLIELVLQGAIHNSLAVTGILAVAEAKRRGWQGLLPPHHPWPAATWQLR